jgi:arylsulfatase A-like enzyme
MLVALPLAAACAQAPPPNLLVVTLDTLRRDHVGAYGASPSPTPQLDALAREGLVFERAYTTMPTTGPAHLSLFTGLRPSAHGGRANGMPLRADLRPRQIGARLREAGFATGAFVAADVLLPRLTGLDFDVYDAPRDFLRPGAQVVRRALAWLEEVHAGAPARPVFLWVHVYDAHAPYGPAAHKLEQLPLDPGLYGWVDAERLASEESRSEMSARYDAGVRDADAALGELVRGARAILGEGGLLLVVVADHGETLGEHLADRGYAYDHGEFLDPECVAIPLVLVGPGIAPGRTRRLVSIRDLYGTLLAAAKVGAGDGAEQSRRDLRAAQAGPPRTLVVERRRVGGIERFQMRRERALLVRSHALFVTDGENALRMGEDARYQLERGDATAEIVATARERLQAVLGQPSPAPELDPEAREALRSLGYGR